MEMKSVNVSTIVRNAATESSWMSWLLLRRMPTPFKRLFCQILYLIRMVAIIIRCLP